MENQVGLRGIAFVEFASPEPQKLHNLFLAFGFSRIMRHKDKAIDLYKQNDIVFLLNTATDSFAEKFGLLHGPSVSSMGWKFENPQEGLSKVEKNAGKPLKEHGDFELNGQPLTAMKGIGDSLIYFVANKTADLYSDIGFVPLEKPDLVQEKGFLEIDHLTNNVAQGTMETWSKFYRELFGFTEVRYFDIRGAATGLKSYALRSPCGTFCIPINEGTEKKSQINEYLEEYKGPGIQHIAFASRDILSSLEKLQGTGIETLDIDDDYYKEVFQRVPNVTEDHARIHKLNVLVDGDDEGYLLQIFTKNIIGPIFIEIIQRKNHHSFGEGNFGALFRSIERDQSRRGVL